MIVFQFVWTSCQTVEGLISAGTSDRASTGSIWAAGGVVGSHVTCNATTFSFAGYDIRTAAFLPFSGAAAAAAVFGEQLSCRDSCRASLKDDMMRWVLMFLMFYPCFAQSLWSFAALGKHKNPKPRPKSGFD
jgi:hypothetical protein